MLMSLSDFVLQLVFWSLQCKQHAQYDCTADMHQDALHLQRRPFAMHLSLRLCVKLYQYGICCRWLAWKVVLL